MLRVPDDLIGKEVKCPACAARALVAAPVAVGGDDMPTLPPTGACPDVQSADENAATLAPFQKADHATLPPPNQTPDKSAPANSLGSETPVQAREVRIPGYELLGELGRGGMGVVYKARHVKLNRLVALKMILAGSHAGASELARFHTEAQAIARLQHPNIVQVHEVSEHEGTPFIALEFCGGGSLAQKLNGTPLPAREAAELLETLARAMQAAHEQHVIHRDLKPANVLFTEAGVPKITDFGLAKKLDEAGQTQSGAIMGTPSYMAPEQAMGESTGIGPSADIYALGAMLYECLTGRPPFKAATSLDTIMQVVMNDPIAPSQLHTKTPRDLETICLTCLNKEPRKRYDTARTFADDLGRFLAGEPILARPVGRVERAAKWVKRNPLVTAMLAMVLLSVVGGATGIFVKYLDAKYQEEIAKEQTVIAVEKTGIAESKAKELKEALIDLDSALRQAREKQAAAEKAEFGRREQVMEAFMAEARAKRYSGRVGQRFGSIAAIRKATAIARELKKPPAVFDELRNLAVAALALPDFQPAVKTWDGWPKGSSGLAFDPVALRQYARGDQQGNVSVRQLHDDVEVSRLPGTGKPRTIVFGADGKTLLLHDRSTGDLERWQIGSTAAEKLATITNDDTKDWGKNIWGWQQSRDGSRLLSLHFLPEGSRAIVIDVPSGKVCFEHKLPVRDAGLMGLASLSPDGRWLAWVDGNYGTAQRNLVLLFDVDAGKHVSTLKNAGNVYSPVWHPDCRTLAVGNSNTCEIYVWDALAGKRIHALRDQTGGNPYLGMSSSGQLLTSRSSWTNGQVFWHPHTGKPLLRTPFPFSITSNVQDGRQFEASIDKNRIILRVAEPGPVYRTFVPDSTAAPGPTQRECHDVAIHRDGRLLAVGHTTGVSLIDLPTGLEVAKLNLGRNPFVRFDAATGDLLTHGLRGLMRWPVQVTPGEPHKVEVGPARILRPGTGSFRNLDLSQDGKTIAIAGGTQAIVYRPKGNRLVPASLGPLQDNRFVHLSPDGRWVLTVAHDAKTGLIWDAETGERVAEVPVGTRGRSAHDGYYGMFFSPDSQWLTDGQRRWKVGTWKEEGPQTPIAEGVTILTFTADGTMFAGQSNDESVHLVDSASGKTLVQLGLPEQNRSWFAAFSPDATQLVLQSRDHYYVCAWDLRALHGHLAELGLDWGDGPLPPAPQTDRRLPPVVTVKGTEPLPAPPPPVVAGEVLLDKKDRLTDNDPVYKPDIKDPGPDPKLLKFIDGNPHKVYTLALKKNDKIVIQQMSEEIDSVVIVENAKNVVLALNDDDPAGNTLNSRLVWTVRADGEYRIIATCMTEVMQNKYGSFQLIVTRTQPGK
jgi:WD40 repeat protein/tRNA A-37 threonylcarbamoyl transferase component Bud32